jgi:nicotinate-nucleotide adenylyltransferase
LLAGYLGTVAGFERVLVVPVFGHAFDKQLSDFEHRLRMCQLAFERLPFVEVSPIEASLQPPNYTLHTLQAVKKAHPDWQLRLAMGSDVLAETAQWHRFDAVAELAPPFVFARHGTDVTDSRPRLLPAVSSSELRARLRHGEAPGIRESLEELIPRGVLDYATNQRLYVP